MRYHGFLHDCDVISPPFIFIIRGELKHTDDFVNLIRHLLNHKISVILCISLPGTSCEMDTALCTLQYTLYMQNQFKWKFGASGVNSKHQVMQYCNIVMHMYISSVNTWDKGESAEVQVLIELIYTWGYYKYYSTYK